MWSNSAIVTAGTVAELYLKARDLRKAKTFFNYIGHPMPHIVPEVKPFKSAIACLQKQNLLAELTAPVLKEILIELYGDPKIPSEQGDILQIIECYYRHDGSAKLSARAITDGFLTHDWRFGQETDDVVAEICTLLGGTPLFKQIRYARPSDSAVHSIYATNATAQLIVENANGEQISFAVDSLIDIVAFFNQELQRRADKRRFISLDTEGDYFAFYLMDKVTYKALLNCKLPALPADEEIPGGIDLKAWK